MGGMVRSERMTLCQIFIPSEAAYFVISELGELGVVQFRDLNKDVTSFHRNFVNEVRRCHEMERKLRYMEFEIESSNVDIFPCSEFVKVLPPNEIADLEVHISRSEEEIKKLTQNADSLKHSSLELLELKYVLEKSETVFRNIGEELYSSAIVNKLNFVTGVINREKIKTFETMLWRISKGNVLFERVEVEKSVEDFATGAKHYKTVFIVCFHGKILMSRINKICEGFRASLYSCPSSSLERRKLLDSVCRRLEDVNMVLNQTCLYRQSFLQRVAHDLRYWNTMVSKIKAIYHVLNFLNMDVTGKCFIGECWIPVRNIPMVKKALAEGSRASGCSVFSFLYVVKTDDEPPTFNRTNKFTRCFQKLVDVYGVASYEEVNPALFSVVTFPFLFAVMFGDVGHAIILVIFALYLVLFEEKILSTKSTSEIFNIFFAGRYLILLMGLFSVYTGLIYNEVFSRSVNLFGSSWQPTFNKTSLIGNLDLHPGEQYVGTPYILGVDPIWSVSTNRIVFINSYKMKMSIIFGVFHMILGLCVKVINFMHFKKYSSIFFEFLPQLTLLCCLFLWLVAMMFIKWVMFSSQNTDVQHGTSCAPSILVSFINMMLLKEESHRTGCDPYFFQFQPQLQKILLFVSLVTIPVMLLGKPLYVLYSRRTYHIKHKDEVHDELSLKFQKSVEKELNMMLNKRETVTDLFIIQVINTVEYALGTISHTSSYLRLWALSLAHSELSNVLWSRVLRLGLNFSGFGGGLALFTSFFVWAFFTLTILVTMEGLSAFLHTLRLHWVEFMSKFYVGRGYPFKPFSFKEILEHKDEEDEDDIGEERLEEEDKERQYFPE